MKAMNFTQLEELVKSNAAEISDLKVGISEISKVLEDMKSTKEVKKECLNKSS